MLLGAAASGRGRGALLAGARRGATFGPVLGLRGCRVLITGPSAGSTLRALRPGTLCALAGGAGFARDCASLLAARA